MSANRQATIGRRWGQFKPSQWGQFQTIVLTAKGREKCTREGLVSKASPGTVALSAWRRGERTGREKEPVMALKSVRTERARTVGHVSHDALLRVDKRVKQILARREAALQQARRAAQRLRKRR
jgi:hypothetical protein